MDTLGFVQSDLVTKLVTVASFEITSKQLIIHNIYVDKKTINTI